MKLIDVEITGTSPLLIHRFTEAAEQNKGHGVIEVGQKDPRTEATKAAYIAPDGTYYFNGASIPACMANAGSGFKMRGSRKSARFVVPAAVRMIDDAVTIRNGDGGPAKAFEVDARPVTIPKTQGKIMRYRPRFNAWSARFQFTINDAMLPIDLAQQLLTTAGESYGIGDFRPEKHGPFGCFRVTLFKESKESKSK